MIESVKADSENRPGGVMVNASEAESRTQESEHGGQMMVSDSNNSSEAG